MKGKIAEPVPVVQPTNPSAEESKNDLTKQTAKTATLDSPEAKALKTELLMMGF